MKNSIPPWRDKIQNFCRGEALITAVVFLLFISLAIIFGFSSLVLKESKIAKDLFFSKKAYFLAEGAAEDHAYRLMRSIPPAPGEEEVLTLDGFTATSKETTVGIDQEVTATSTVANLMRKVKIKLTVGTGLSFFYGVQAGEGGFSLANSSKINGNVFTNGPIIGTDASEIGGTAISAGPNGLIEGIYASSSSAYAHTIRTSTIDEEAFYQVIDGSTEVGPEAQYCPNPYCNSDFKDVATSSMPISDSLIGEWEAAATTTVISSSECTGDPKIYKITSSTTTGPLTIDCKLEISGSKTVVTLKGPLWVKGDIDIRTGSTIRVDSSLGRASVAIIAHDPFATSTKGIILVQQGSNFLGSGTQGSYILLVSQNNSAETGGSTKAIIIEQSSSGVLLVYAGHGEIALQNKADLKEVTAYKVSLAQSTEVTYEIGLANMLFTSGPGGGLEIIDWLEI